MYLIIMFIMEQGLNNVQHYKNVHAIHPKNNIYLHLISTGTRCFPLINWT